MQLVHDLKDVWTLSDDALAALADRLIAAGETKTMLYAEVRKRITEEMIPKAAPAMRAAFGRPRPKAAQRADRSSETPT